MFCFRIYLCAEAFLSWTLWNCGAFYLRPDNNSLHSWLRAWSGSETKFLLTSHYYSKMFHAASGLWWPTIYEQIFNWWSSFDLSGIFRLILKCFTVLQNTEQHWSINSDVSNVLLTSLFSVTSNGGLHLEFSRQ